MRARPRSMSPYAYDYGAGGAALFDIVNVQIWTRRRASAHRQGRFHPGSGAAIILSNCKAGLAHRAEHSPRKREAGGSSPPASTTANGRNRPVAGRRFGKAEIGVRSAVAAPYCTRGETADAAASEAAAARHGGSSPPGCTILVCAQSRGGALSARHTNPAHSARFAKRPRHRFYIPTFPGSSPGASTKRFVSLAAKASARHAGDPQVPSPRRSTSIVSSRSSMAERLADNRKTAVRHRAGEPSTQAGDHHD